MTTLADSEFEKSGLHLDDDGNTVFNPHQPEHRISDFGNLINEETEARRLHLLNDGHSSPETFETCRQCQIDWNRYF